METLSKSNSASLSKEEHAQSRFAYIMTVLPTASVNWLGKRRFSVGDI